MKKFCEISGYFSELWSDIFSCEQVFNFCCPEILQYNKQNQFHLSDFIQIYKCYEEENDIIYPYVHGSCPISQRTKYR